MSNPVIFTSSKYTHTRNCFFSLWGKISMHGLYHQLFGTPCIIERPELQAGATAAGTWNQFILYVCNQTNCQYSCKGREILVFLQEKKTECVISQKGVGFNFLAHSLLRMHLFVTGKSQMIYRHGMKVYGLCGNTSGILSVLIPIHENAQCQVEARQKTQPSYISHYHCRKKLQRLSFLKELNYANKITTLFWWRLLQLLPCVRRNKFQFRAFAFSTISGNAS